MRQIARILMCAGCVLTWALAPALAAQNVTGAETQAEAKAEDSKAKAQSAQAKVVMDTLNVTAKRYQAEDLDTGSFTTVITAQDVEKKGGDNAYEVLQRTEGMNFSSSLPGGITQGGMNGEIGIRGISGGEQIMLNGIPIIEPTAGSYDLDQIPSAFLERIEVVKGANSALYGSRAMTGVVNMRTRRPGEDAIGGRLLGGSNDYFNGDAWYRNKYVFLGASYMRYDDITDAKRNYSTRSPYNTSLNAPQKYSAMIAVQPWTPVVISYMFNYTNTGYNAQYTKKPTSSYEVDEKVYHHYLTATYERGAFRATGFFNYNYMDTDYDYYGAAGKPGRDNEKKSFTTGLDAQNSTMLWNTLFLYGGTYIFEQQDEVRQDVKGSSSSGYYIDSIDLDNTRHLPSLFIQAEKTFFSDLILTLGIRGQGVISTEEDSDNYYEPVPQFQAVYKLTDRQSFYGNVGRAFRVPTFNQLYSETATLVGNPNLEPEYGWTYELGYKVSYGIFTGTLAAFLMDYTDKIRYVKNPEDDRYYAQNMDKYRTTGVEWKLTAQVHEYLQLAFGGYAADPWEEEDGEREQAGPKWQMVPGIYYDDGTLQLGLNATTMLERERGLDDYFNLHFTGSYKLTNWLKLRVKADNLLDQDLAVYGNMTPGYSSQYEVLDPGLWVYAGVEIDLNLL
ncbi:MAG: TonB-dependent receptor [Deltaproteobacteria bacterium]|nr:TonB-dependent receptor [Deltaproteobacteria bacterium]